MRFWNSLIGKHPDPLNNDIPVPYFKCKNDKWEIVRTFDWSEYIDSAWDERINYSLFRNDTLLSKVAKQMALLPFDDSSDCYCVNDEIEEIQDDLQQKYYLYQEHLLNLSGHRTLPPELTPAGILDEILENRSGRKNSGWRKKMLYEIKEFLDKRQERASLKKNN